MNNLDIPKRTWGEVAATLGVLTGWEVSTDPENKKFPSDDGFLSASTLKKYIENPILTMRQKMLKTHEKPTHSSKTLENFRVGRAVHAHCLEPDSDLEARFPVFKGARRSGKDWEEFCAKHEAAHKNGDVLSRGEAAVVKSVMQVGRGFAARRARLEEAGAEVLLALPEVSFWAKFANGYELKVRVDELKILKDAEGRFSFEIADVKTTSKSTDSVAELAEDIAYNGYHTQAAMYLYVVQSVLRVAQCWRQLGLEHNMPGEAKGWAESIPGGFSLFWISKGELTAAWQPVFMTTFDAPDSAWNAFGISSMLVGLQEFSRMAHRAGELTAGAKDWDTITKEPQIVQVPVTRKTFYAMKNVADKLDFEYAKYAVQKTQKQIREEAVGKLGICTPLGQLSAEKATPKKDAPKKDAPKKDAPKKDAPKKDAPKIQIPTETEAAETTEAAAKSSVRITIPNLPTDVPPSADWVMRATKKLIKKHSWLKKTIEERGIDTSVPLPKLRSELLDLKEIQAT